MNKLHESRRVVDPETGENPNESRAWGKMTGPGRWYHKVAADLDRAWAVARLTPCERILLQYVREHTWGRKGLRGPDPAPCELNLAAVARMTGSGRKRLGIALAALVRDALLVEIEGRYAIGKHVPSWGGGRIDAVGLRYAAGLAPGPAEAGRVFPHGAAALVPRASFPGRDARRSGDDPRAGNDALAGRERRAGGPGTTQAPAVPHRNAGAEGEIQRGRENPSSSSSPAISTPPARMEFDEEEDTYRTDSGRVPGGDEPFVAPPGPLPEGARAQLDAARRPRDPEDERLEAWVHDRVREATGVREIADDFRRGVGYWRAKGVGRHVIAGFVDEAMRFRLGDARGKVPIHKITVYVHRAITKYQPGEAIPPVPDEWRPAPRAIPAPTARQLARRAYLRESDARLLAEIEARKAARA